MESGWELSFAAADSEDWRKDCVVVQAVVVQDDFCVVAEFLDGFQVVEKHWAEHGPGLERPHIFGPVLSGEAEESASHFLFNGLFPYERCSKILWLEDRKWLGDVEAVGGVEGWDDLKLGFGLFTEGGGCELEGELGEVGVVELVDGVAGVEEVEVGGGVAGF